jgi:hypothetical protein
MYMMSISAQCMCERTTVVTTITMCSLAHTLRVEHRSHCAYCNAGTLVVTVG